MTEPANLELSIAGAICIDPRSLTAIRETGLSADDFTNIACSCLYDAAVEAADRGKTFDAVTLSEALAGVVDTFIHMALDIEHFAKVKLLRALEISSCDGYDIVKKYRAHLKEEDERKNSKRSVHLENELARNNNNPYCGGIIQSYSNNYPMWAFIEIIPLGSFVDFYGFCANELSDVDKSLRDDYYLLKTIKELRNAAAHSNCIINSMGAKDSRAQANYCVIRGIDSISKSRRDRQLKNERMRQMVTMLYLHKEIVTSNGVHNRAKKDLNDAVERMYKNIEFYRDNATVLSFFSFFKDSVDIFFS